jgi:hypothetical protein
MLSLGAVRSRAGTGKKLISAQQAGLQHCPLTMPLRAASLRQIPKPLDIDTAAGSLADFGFLIWMRLR